MIQLEARILWGVLGCTVLLLAGAVWLCWYAVNHPPKD